MESRFRFTFCALLALPLSAAAGCKYEASTEYSAHTSTSTSTSGGDAVARAKRDARRDARRASKKRASKPAKKASAKGKVRVSASGTKHSKAIRRAKQPPAPSGLGGLGGRLALAGKLDAKARARAEAEAKRRAAAGDQAQQPGGQPASDPKLKIGRKPTEVAPRGEPAPPRVLPKPRAVGDDAGKGKSKLAAKPKPPPEAPPNNEFGYDDPVLGCFEGHVYFIPEKSSKLPTSYEGLEASSVLYACEWDIPPRKWSKGFPGVEDRFEWFAIRYSGAFHVADAGTYTFRISSDDGAKLYINGKLVVDNDGVHPPKEKSGAIVLAPGDHTMVLEYFQGPRHDINLQLFVTPPGGEEGLFSVRD